MAYSLRNPQQTHVTFAIPQEQEYVENNQGYKQKPATQLYVYKSNHKNPNCPIIPREPKHVHKIVKKKDIRVLPYDIIRRITRAVRGKDFTHESGTL
jgi:hypothetical protein